MIKLCTSGGKDIKDGLACLVGLETFLEVAFFDLEAVILALGINTSRLRNVALCTDRYRKA